MEIILAEHAGFCFGVNRAMDLALKIGKDKDGKVHTLGPLIHNPQAVKKLEEVDVRVESDIEKITEGTVIIRSHGVPPEILEQAEKQELEVVNATCPFVKTAQRNAKELMEEGYDVVISGDQDHPEVIAILGYTDNQAIIVQDESDFEKLDNLKKAGVVAQTTQSLERLQKLTAYLLKNVSELKVYNTICTTTGQRQREAARLSKKVDMMIVIGGYNSANTNRLAEICSESGVKTHHIERAEELNKDWFKNIKKVGITAGASTPNWIIKEVLKRMSEIKEKHEENLEENILTKGQVVSGQVEQITEDGVYVNVGTKTEGFIPANEVSNVGKAIGEVLSEGEEVKVFVLNPEDEEGKAILSKRRADSQEAWDKIEAVYNSGEVIEAEVTKEVKGGLVADIGLRGFIPASHVSVDYVEDLSQFVGETLSLKVIEVERENNNVVLSHKVILEKEREKKKEELLNSLEEGQVVEGTITKIVDFGAFVDLGGAEGLLHISEISWGRIDHPTEVLEEGEEIKVMVLSVKPEEGRISLGLKQTQRDPWEEFIEEYKVGDVLEGKITKTVDFGAFMEIKPGVEGLIHISQLSRKHVDTVEEVVSSGDKVEAKVINIEEDDRRIGLSMKELEPVKASKPKKKSKAKPQFNTQNEDEGSGVKLGDVFGDLFEN
ncbi:bifunctional 4-hydroxy-3-methylbut-2-enyl diphosphate reductase/30S ribosomal protein S1 [Orenia marismortui]|uniref:4-hydroxy-3-methylbut-2-enyl diphosphate reductase n=1 Tax=Orenia marismortui TaxID=46469 RepID=A0A4R8H1I6_9FIRM|nr:bifunctional 4-hydroxy-3-methylbut-2-enyl diphosphate reductase/30S ribosomal protein S1 [Orenia marismortui]TDX53304.1 4-hydroxy-3-methylbut-2-enyl diphosphate reductase [Orenia marismortui]